MMVSSLSPRTMSVFLFIIIFDVLVISSLAANSSSSDILYQIETIPYVTVYKNGSVARLFGTTTVPASLHPSSPVLSKDVLIQPTLNISARLYLPNIPVAAARKLPIFVYYHGGAFCTETPFSPTYHTFLTSLVTEAKIAAVSVNYRRAPEYPLPAAYQDSFLALKWVFSHRNGSGNEPWLRTYVDFNRVYIGGDSAGGNIAHNVAMHVGLESTTGRDKGEGNIVIQGMFLNCPHFWGKTRIGKEASNPKMVALEESIWLHAYPNSTGFDDPASNPGMDPNLGRLACKKVLIYVTEKDVLRDRGLYYKKALEKSKWNGIVKVVEVKGEGHVFNLNSPNTTKAKAMLKRVAMFLNDEDKLLQ